MDRVTGSNNHKVSQRSSSPNSSPMPNIGLSLLERINCALERKRGLSVRNGKVGGDGVQTDSSSGIKNNLSDCAKDPELLAASKGGHRKRPATGLEKQHCAEKNISSVPMLTLAYEDDDDDNDCNMKHGVTNDNTATSRLGELHSILNEKELPVTLKTSTITAETSATSGPALKYAAMESLSFSKKKEKEMSKVHNSETLQAMNKRDLTRIEKKRARDIEKQTKHLATLEQKQKKLEEREAKKKKQDQEKISRKAEAMTAKADSLDQCLKHMTVVLDSEVMKDGGGAILQSLENMGVQYEVKKLPCDATIGWMRNRVEFVAEENGQIKRKSTYTEEDQILMRIKAADLASMINSGPPAASSRILASYISKVQRLLPNKKCTMIVTGIDSYTKLVKAKSALKKPQSHHFPAISKSALDDALLELQIQHHCCVHFCENADELAQMVCSFTKAVAEKPYKKPNGVAFDIYLDNHEKGLPRVDKDGQGLLDVWVRQLQQFKSVGYDTAAAIVQRYPSPYLLFKEFRSCSTTLEASLLLQDIEVRRGHGVLATSRRVGPELSKRIHTFLMSLDGHADLAKS